VQPPTAPNCGHSDAPLYRALLFHAQDALIRQLAPILSARIGAQMLSGPPLRHRFLGYFPWNRHRESDASNRAIANRSPYHAVFGSERFVLCRTVALASIRSGIYGTSDRGRAVHGRCALAAIHARMLDEAGRHALNEQCGRGAAGLGNACR
jgi:hypothetical protein